MNDNGAPVESFDQTARLNAQTAPPMHVAPTPGAFPMSPTAPFFDGLPRFPGNQPTTYPTIPSFPQFEPPPAPPPAPQLVQPQVLQFTEDQLTSVVDHLVDKKLSMSASGSLGPRQPTPTPRPPTQPAPAPRSHQQERYSPAPAVKTTSPSRSESVISCGTETTGSHRADSLTSSSRSNPDDEYEHRYRSTLNDFKSEINSILQALDSPLKLLGTQNFIPWREKLLSDATLIGANEILEQQQQNPPNSFTPLQKLKWDILNNKLVVRIYASLSASVVRQYRTLRTPSAVVLWEAIDHRYAKSRAQQRLATLKQLIELRATDATFASSLNVYHTCVDTLSELYEDCPVSMIFHDLFLHCFSSCQPDFMRKILDEFYATGRKSIVPVDIKEVADQLDNRIAAPGESKRRTESSGGTLGVNSMQSSHRSVPRNHSSAHSSGSTDKHHRQRKSRHRKREHQKPNADSESRTDGADDSSSVVLPNSPALAAVTIAKTAAVSSCATFSGVEWLFDSCASHHITGNRDAFISLRSLSSGPVISPPTSTTLRAVGIGTVLLQLADTTVTVSGVYFAPGITENLLSLGQLEDQNFSLQYKHASSPAFWVLRSPEGIVMYAVRHSITNVYVVSACPPDDFGVEENFHSAIALAKTCSVAIQDQPARQVTKSMKQWHESLGHIHLDAIIALVKNKANGMVISGSRDKHSFFCEACAKASITRRYSTTSMPRAVKPLAKVHIDIAGGGTSLQPTLSSEDANNLASSREGYKYFFIITDDATRYRWVYFLHTKDSAFDSFVSWVKFIKNHGMTPPAVLRSDIDGVFRSKRMQIFLNECGTKWEPTASESPWQDGVAERSIGIVMNRVRAVLISASLPLKFWSDVLLHVLFITNNSPTSTMLFNTNFWRIDKNGQVPPCPQSIPYFAFTSQQPSFTHLQPIGADVIVHQHGSRQPPSKLHPRGKMCKLVGYQSPSLCRVWDLETGKVFSSADIIFPPPSAPSGPSDPSSSSSPETVPPASAVVNSIISPSSTHKIDVSSLPDFETSDMWLWPADHFSRIHVSSAMSHSAPKGFKKATSSQHSSSWWRSMRREINDLEVRKAWTLVPVSDVPPDAKIARGNWVYTEKDRPKDVNADPDGVLRKSRWVINGNELDDVPLEESFAPVVNQSTNRMCFALGAQFGWVNRQADVIVAYLYGRLKQPVYMRQPVGFENGEPGTLVCRVEGSLYGLDPAARIWYNLFTGYLRELHFRVSQYDPGLWLLKADARFIIVTLYVDDLNIFSRSSADGDWLIECLRERLDLKDLHIPQRYLGMEFAKNDDGSVSLSQVAYCSQLVDDFGLFDSTPLVVPIQPGFVIDDSPVAESEAGFTVRRYQHGVGCLQHLANTTRPDLARAASLLGTYNARPTIKCWQLLQRVVKYIKGTMHIGLTYRHHTDGLSVEGFCDSDWAGTLHRDKKSTSGYVFCFNGTPVSWRSSKQDCISLSSNEAEYVALSDAAREAVWIRSLLVDLGVRGYEPITLNVDNLGAINLAKIDGNTRRSKHIDVRYHYSRRQYLEGTIGLRHISTHEMAADGLTKPLALAQFSRFRDMLGIDLSAGDKTATSTELRQAAVAQE